MLVQLNPNPIIVLATYVEVPAAIQNISNLFILVKMLVEECLYFILVDVAHLLGRNGDLIAVLVPSF